MLCCELKVSCLTRPTYRIVRRDIIELVLATDMSKHFEHLQRFKHFLPSLIQYYNSEVLSSAVSVTYRY